MRELTARHAYRALIVVRIIHRIGFGVRVGVVGGTGGVEVVVGEGF